MQEFDDNISNISNVDSVVAISFLRTIQQHHVHLSSMADQKAGLLIGGGFVSTSIIGASGTLMVSTTLFGLLMAAATFLAIYAVAPRLGRRRTAEVEAEAKKKGTPLMFFGEFSRLPREEYVKEMEKVLHSNPDVYHNMIEDIYSLGKMLYEKKYKFLTWSYRVFMAAMVIGPVAWFIEKWILGN